MEKMNLSTCIKGEPLMKMGGGEAPILNYNLPASTAFEVINPIPLNIPKEWFKAKRQKKSEKNVWQRAKELSLDEITQDCFALFNGVPSKYGLFMNQKLLKGVTIPFEENRVFVGSTSQHYEANVEVSHMRKMEHTPYNPPPRTTKDYKDKPVKVKTNNGTALSPKFGNPRQMAHYIKEGYIPFIFKNFVGEIDIEYKREPKALPIITMVEHYRVATYARDYGAAKTVGTFSLLPGEKTTISIRSYSKKESTKFKSENILDSFTQNSASTLENTIQSESHTKSGDEISEIDSDFTSSNQNTNSQSNFGYEFGGAINIGISLGPVGQLGGSLGGGINGSTTSSTIGGESSGAEHTITSSSIREQANTQLQNALDRTVAESSAHRQVDINTTTSEISTEEQETTIVRELVNTNYSRCLNFVFRQMTQQYLSITYMHDVSFVFTNGYPDSKIVVKLDGLEQFLMEVLDNPEYVKYVLRDVLIELCNVMDYQGNAKQFAICEHFKLEKCCGEKVVSNQHILHKNPKLETQIAGITVKGVVLDVRERILPVEHVIVDALLGQGEALDCYNMRQQNAAAERDEIANQTSLIQNDVKKIEAENRQKELELQLEIQKIRVQEMQFELDKKNQELALEVQEKQLDLKKQQQAMGIIDKITDPLQKAEFYKKVFGNCCDTPQTQIIQ
jgi:hypothetical protein